MGILAQRLAQAGAPRMVDMLSKGGFTQPAHISIADNRFTLVNTLGDQFRCPQLYIDTVIAASREETIRTFYDRPYNKDADEEEKVPLCASQDGITPDVGVLRPQAAHCGSCEQNRFGP